MIKNYKQFNESLRDLMVGPTEEEFWNTIKDLQPQEILNKSHSNDYDKGIKYAVEHGADYTKLTDVFNHTVKLLNISNDDVIEFMKSQGNDNDDILRISSYLHFQYGIDYAISNGALEGLTPNNLLIKSCEIGYLDGVKKALKKRANINVRNGYPLQFVTNHFFNYEIMKYLIEQGAGVNPRDIYFINNIIEKVSLKDDNEFMKYLYEKGYKLTDNEEHNSQALVYAWNNDNTELMKIIIQMGGYPSKAKNTMVKISIMDNDVEKVKVLLEGGSDLEITDDMITKLENNTNVDRSEMIELLKSYMNKSMNESLRDLMVGPTEEEVWDSYMKGKLKGLITSIPESPEDFFNQMKEGCVEMGKEYNFIYWGKNNKILFWQELKDKKIWIKYERIWSVLEMIYGLDYGEIRTIISNILTHDINWSGYLPIRLG